MNWTVRVEKNKSVFSLSQVVFQAAALTLNSDFSELATKTCSSFDSSLGLEAWVFWCWCPGLLIRQPVIDRMIPLGVHSQSVQRCLLFWTQLRRTFGSFLYPPSPPGQRLLFLPLDLHRRALSHHLTGDKNWRRGRKVRTGRKWVERMNTVSKEKLTIGRGEIGEKSEHVLSPPRLWKEKENMSNFNLSRLQSVATAANASEWWHMVNSSFRTNRQKNTKLNPSCAGTDAAWGLDARIKGYWLTVRRSASKSTCTELSLIMTSSRDNWCEKKIYWHVDQESPGICQRSKVKYHAVKTPDRQRFLLWHWRLWSDKYYCSRTMISMKYNANISLTY